MLKNIASALLTSVVVLSGTAEAASINVDFEEIGNDVTISYAGTLDLTGLAGRSAAFVGTVQSGNGFFSSEGAGRNFVFTIYTSPNEGPLSFGNSFAVARPDEYTGSQFALSALDGIVGVRQGYVSNEAIEGSATLFDESFASLGIDGLVKSFSFGQNTITYNSQLPPNAVPLPAALPMLALTIFGLALFRRRTSID